MTKSQIISALATTLNVSKVAARNYIDAYSALVTRTLKKEGAIVIPDVAKLVVVKTPPRAARTIKSPRDGQSMTIAAKPAGKKLRARFSRGLKIAVGQLSAAPKRPRS